MGEQLSRYPLDSGKSLVTLTQGLCKSSPLFPPQHELAKRASVRMILIFPYSALTGTEEPAGTAWAAARIHHGTSRAGGAEEASPGTAARRG